MPSRIGRGARVPARRTTRPSGARALENTGSAIFAGWSGRPATTSTSPAWDLVTESTAKIAVVDSGVALDHPDLRANLLTAEGRDFVDGGLPYDGSGHGTHVAGTIGASGDNAQGVTGVVDGGHRPDQGPRRRWRRHPVRRHRRLRPRRRRRRADREPLLGGDRPRSGSTTRSARRPTSQPRRPPATTARTSTPRTATRAPTTFRTSSASPRRGRQRPARWLLELRRHVRGPRRAGGRHLQHVLRRRAGPNSYAYLDGTSMATPHAAAPRCCSDSIPS